MSTSANACGEHSTHEEAKMRKTIKFSVPVRVPGTGQWTAVVVEATSRNAAIRGVQKQNMTLAQMNDRRVCIAE